MAEEHELPHKLTLHGRSKLSVTGVTEVIRFEETAAVLRTSVGLLVIQGEDLQLKSLSPDSGAAAVTGTVAALSYEEPRSPGGWIRRLLG